MKWDLETLRLSFLFNIKQYKVRKSQEFPQIKHANLSWSHLLKKKMKLKFPIISNNFNTNQTFLCIYPNSWFICQVWFKLIYKIIQVPTVMIDCIDLQHGIWVLAGEKCAGYSAPYITGKISKQRIWSKLKNISSCTFANIIRCSRLQLWVG